MLFDMATPGMWGSVDDRKLRITSMSGACREAKVVPAV